MNKYCSGCGVKMQDDNILGLGFTTNIENDYCMRCFRLKNYGDYESVSSNVLYSLFFFKIGYLFLNKL